MKNKSRLSLYFAVLLLFGSYHMQAQNKITPAGKEVLQTAEVMPQFPGGQNALFLFMSENTRYPASAQQLGIEGTVYVGFIVEPDGSINNISILKGLPEGGSGIEAEALRVTALMPKWEPGVQDGNKVRVSYSLPFKFKLDRQRKIKKLMPD
ncbi:energy transducer TonB [Sphingobacteriales bacterium UPWRP_1]|nr:hypothetical protein B6N25_11415 [Sphingobacteriales bacterium TSM_CSS]PSJ77578.1 energy transducer TonB [Sphingobacteriales bacterium UPWRP_1]